MIDRNPIEFVIDALETTLIIHPDEKLLQGNYMNYGPVADIMSTIGPLISTLNPEEFRECDSRIDELLGRYELK